MRANTLESLQARGVRNDAGCLLWTGAVNKEGYGIVSWRSQSMRVHQVIWGFVYGPMLPGYEIDHTCRVKHCFEPTHLEMVTKPENIIRAVPFREHPTACPAGHVYDEANTYRFGNRRACKECRREAVRRYRVVKGSGPL